MKRLLAFGDSWTAGHGVEDDIKYEKVPFPPEFIQKLRLCNSWPHHLSHKFDIPYVNLGVCGYGNLDILETVLDVFKNNFQRDDDIFIIMLSYPHRYRLKKPNNDPKYVITKLEDVLKNHTHFYFNSFYPTFKDEDDMENFEIPQSFIHPYKCVSDYIREYEINNNELVWEYGKASVWNDVEGLWQGFYHPNNFGYKLISNYIYNSIKDKL